MTGRETTASRALDAAGIPWTEVFPGCGSFALSDAVAAAVSVGLAAAAFACRLAPPGAVEVSLGFGLPALPSSEIVLLSTLTDAKSCSALRTLASAFREHVRPRLSAVP